LSRERIEKIDLQFADLNRARLKLAREAGDQRIYETADVERLWPVSVGLNLIRSAAVVEQTINGITVRLWDDPFEWTLPERLPSVADLIAYFEEVEMARVKGFQFLKDDADLEHSIPAPVELKTLDHVLSGTLTASQTYLSEARSYLSSEAGTKK
jgi:hypothetical protein